MASDVCLEGGFGQLDPIPLVLSRVALVSAQGDADVPCAGAAYEITRCFPESLVLPYGLTRTSTE